MQPAKIDLLIYQGTTYKKYFQLTQGENFTPVDLTDCKIRMQIREKLKDTAVILELTTENDRIQITDAINGYFRLYLTDDLTSALNIKSGVYDIEIIDGNLEVSRFSEGTVLISPEVTRNNI